MYLDQHHGMLSGHVLLLELHGVVHFWDLLQVVERNMSVAAETADHLHDEITISFYTIARIPPLNNSLLVYKKYM